MKLGNATCLAAAVCLPLTPACLPASPFGYDGGPQGCTGVCSTDGGSDGGNLTDGGPITAVTTIAALRQVQPLGVHAQIQQVVVTAIALPRRCGSDPVLRIPFWVADLARPSNGLWVDPGCEGAGWVPDIGQVLTLDGYLQLEPSTRDVVGGRLTLSNASEDAGLLSVQMDASVPAPADTETDAGFGNADGGWVVANPELAGARVHIPGPLFLTDATPKAFSQYFLGTLNGYGGFELSGGILVSEALLPLRTDGGSGCAWDGWARDGGGIVFDAGVRGVWDTYSHAPCIDGGYAADGGPYCATNGRARGFVPGTDAGYTLVLYPEDCLNDLPGTVDAGGL